MIFYLYIVVQSIRMIFNKTHISTIDMNLSIISIDMILHRDTDIHSSRALSEKC